jgi:hypothetical protein
MGLEKAAVRQPLRFVGTDRAGRKAEFAVELKPGCTAREPDNPAPSSTGSHPL